MSKENGIVLNRQNTRSYRRDLLKLSTKQIIKQCKSKNIAVTSSKADMVKKLVQKQRLSLKKGVPKSNQKTPISPTKTKPNSKIKISQIHRQSGRKHKI